MTHLVESRDLFFLSGSRNSLQQKSYDDMFQAIRALNVQKVLKIRILSQNSCKMKPFSRFL